jgi:hypothetical protein
VDAIEKGLIFYTLFTNGCNGCMLDIKHPKHLIKYRGRNPTATRTQNRTQIRIRFGALKQKESKNDISPHSNY